MAIDRPARTRPRARPNQQGVRSERSRSQILRAALKLFSTRGYHGTSVRDIADAAHVSVGNVYHQFLEKEAIFNTLLERYLACARPTGPALQ